MTTSLKHVSLWLTSLALLAGCAAHGTPPPALTQARSSYQQLAADSAVLASAPKDVMRAGDSLERAERLASYWGSAEDVEHYAYLSQRYSAIAREHSVLTAEQQQLARLQLERERLQLALREARLIGVQQQGLWLEEQMLSLATTETERGLVMSLGDVLFDADRAELKGAANRTVLKLFQFLQLNPQRTVRIEGYTDNRGLADDNLALSSARAQAVADVLIDLGIAPERIKVQGHGAAFPVAANASSRGRAQNRRVEIVFSDEQGRLAPPRE
ncbi:putative lipoprotein YiaD precursor [compost metagenome]|uniref:Outer membrane protein OmpA n=1 Tax=Pseudomonas linyingensis TaxID=915471 RepID=A0A1H6UQ43_9PSED|nr:OmpA family protein [Pseudomonas linyingensis]MCM2319632.1 OmpA family protein [Pseudomonas sp.]SEI94533.1 Outer membrane protein OmpA [Pseudomonas linyingensis]